MVELGQRRLDVIDLVNVELAGVRSEFLPDVALDLHAQLLCQISKRILEGINIGSGSTVVQPSDTLETDASIDDFDGKLLS